MSNVQPFLFQGLIVSDARNDHNQEVIPPVDETILVVLPTDSEIDENSKITLEQIDGGVEDAPKGVKYEERVVAFVDFLGFKNLIKESANDNAKLIRIYSALDAAVDDSADAYIREIGFQRTPDDFDDRLNTFSDFIVMSVRANVEEIGLMVYFLFKKCRELLNLGFACRGGVTFGKLLHDKFDPLDPSLNRRAQKVFGPAFIEAYQLESEHADGPRILISNKVNVIIKRYCDDNPDDRLAKFLMAHIKRSDDGPLYIDLFADFCKEENGYYQDSDNLLPEIKNIRTHLEKMLHDSSDHPHIFKKNAYLARQFNAAVHRSGYASSTICSTILPRG